MRGKTYTVSASVAGNSTSGVYIPDRHISPFNIGFGCAPTATSAIFTVQHTFQDPLQVSAGGLTWFNHEFVVNSSAAIDGNYAFPVGGIRVQIASGAACGVSTTFIQAGIVG